MIQSSTFCSADFLQDMKFEIREGNDIMSRAMLRLFNIFVNAAWQNHTTLHEAESIKTFSIVYVLITNQNK